MRALAQGRKLKKRAKKKEDENLESLASPAAENFLKAPKKIHPSRPRKKFVGELIQMDAIPFIWFGKETTNLHLAIDDASGNIV